MSLTDSSDRGPAPGSDDRLARLMRFRVEVKRAPRLSINPLPFPLLPPRDPFTKMADMEIDEPTNQGGDAMEDDSSKKAKDKSAGKKRFEVKKV